MALSVHYQFRFRCFTFGFGFGLAESKKVVLVDHYLIGFLMKLTCGRVATSMHWTRMRFDIGVNANVMSFDISLECGGKITLITFVLVCSSVVHLDMNAKLAIGWGAIATEITHEVLNVAMDTIDVLPKGMRRSTLDRAFRTGPSAVKRK